MRVSRALHRIDRYLVPSTGAANAWIATLGAASGIAIAYFLAARLGLALLAKPSDVAVFWPASGVAAGILISAGRRAGVALVIGVVIGTVAANLMSDRTLLTSILKGFCNAGEAVLIAWLLERWFGRPFSFCDLHRVVGFLAGAVLAAATSALGGAATMTEFHTAAPFWDVWRMWFLSDAVGIVVAAPLFIELGQRRELPPRAEVIQGVGVLALMALASIYATTLPPGSWLSFDPDAVVFPLLLWLAASNKRIFAIAGALVASIAVIGATTYGTSLFGDASVPIMERLFGAQVVVTMMTAFTLVLTALFAERNKVEDALRLGERRAAKKSIALARLHDAGSHLWRKRDLRQVLDEINAGAIELLDADMGHIQILDAKRGVLEVVTHRGIGQEFLDLIREVSAADGSASGRALRSGERIVIADTESDARYIPFRPIARTAGYRAVQSTPIMSSQGRPLGMLSTYFRSAHQPNVEDLSLLDLYVRLAADIIERHQSDNALRESEERLRLAQLKTGVGIWDWNLSSGQLAWTSQLTAIFGLEPDSVKGYADFRDRVHPEDIDAVEAQRDAAVRRRETFNLEFRIVRPDGQVRWVSAVGGAFYDEATGEPVRILGNNIDITERKGAEQTLAERNAQFDLARKAVRVGTYTYDNVARDMQLSSASAAILGLPPGTTKITGKDWRARVHPDDLQRLTTERRHAFQHWRPELVGEFRIIRPDGEVRWIEARARIAYDDGGQPTRMIGVYIDVTERRQSDDHKTLLIAELDHRVKNVLACVAAVAQQSQECSKSAEEFLKMLNGRITSLSNAHALLSRGHWEGVALTELVCSELAFCTKDENALIEGPAVDLAAEATQPVAMVLHELVTNAAKYGALSNGDGRVSVNWRRQPNGGSGGNLVLEWRETGGPPVVEPNASGYGTSVIRDLIPYELGGSVDFVLAPEGARCRLEIPAKWLSDSSRRRGAANGADASHTPAESLTR